MDHQNTRFRTCDPKLVPVDAVVHSGGGKIVVAGALTYRGLTELHVVPDKQVANSTYYRDHILPFYSSEVERLYGSSFGRVRLMENGAKPHTATVSRAWVDHSWPGGALGRAVVTFAGSERTWLGSQG